MIKKPPNIPVIVKISPTAYHEYKAAKTGSKMKIKAVCVGVSIRCAQTITPIAINVAKTPVINKALISLLDQIIEGESMIV